MLCIQTCISNLVEMLSDNPGTRFVHCHVGFHMASGMLGVYTVIPRNPVNPSQNRKQIEQKQDVNKEHLEQKQNVYNVECIINK